MDSDGCLGNVIGFMMSTDFVFRRVRIALCNTEDLIWFSIKNNTIQFQSNTNTIFTDHFRLFRKTDYATLVFRLA